MEKPSVPNSEVIYQRRMDLLDALLRAGVRSEPAIFDIMDKVLTYCQAISESAISEAIRTYEDKILKDAQTSRIM